MSTLLRADSVGNPTPAQHCTKFHVGNLEFQFSDSDVVNPDDFVPAGESNPWNVRPWFLHDSGFCLAVVFADCLQDAIDIAVDAGCLGVFSVNFDTDASTPEWQDYGPTREEAFESDRISWLGNHGEPHDIEGLGTVELPNPAFSFVAIFNAREGGQL